MNPISLVVVFAAVACVWSAAVEPDNEEVMEEKEQGTATAALMASVSYGKLAAKIKERKYALSKAFPEVKDLKDRTGSLELVIANDSKYTLTSVHEYSVAGTYLSRPDPDIAPGDATIATLVPQNSWFTGGVTGGMSWKIGDTGKYLTIGFNNPYAGSFKTWIGVLDRIDAKHGYLKALYGSLKLLSDNGFALLAVLKDSEIADRRVIFGIMDE